MGAVEQRSQIDCAMLDQVVEEMARDNRPDLAETGQRPFANPAAELSAPPPPPTQRPPEHSPAPAPTPAPTPAPSPTASTERPEHEDEKSDLRAAIAMLSRAIEGSASTEGDLAKRVEALEARLEEQEQSVRYLLQLLIEWLDKDGRKAA